MSTLENFGSLRVILRKLVVLAIFPRQSRSAPIVAVLVSQGLSASAGTVPVVITWSRLGGHPFIRRGALPWSFVHFALQES